MNTIRRLSNDRKPGLADDGAGGEEHEAAEEPAEATEQGGQPGRGPDHPGLEHPDRVPGDRERQRREAERRGEEQVDRQTP